MRMKHSFFIMDVDCVISLKALLTYIAERVHLGYMCLFCSRMFKNARRCQQHMLDKGHSFMNLEDEHEYEQFYDFSKTYEGHPEVENLIKVTKTEEESPAEKKAKASSDKPHDEWEDVDFEDANEDEVAEDKKSESQFSVITEDNKPDVENSSFTIIDTSDKKDVTKNPFHNEEDTLSSIKDDKVKKGVTREEARLGLKIKPAQLLETGEILLSNGNIIGTKSLAYIYRQRFRPNDKREAVVINKLQVEYRRMHAIANGDPSEMFKNGSCISKNHIDQAIINDKRGQVHFLKIGMKKTRMVTRPQI